MRLWRKFFLNKEARVLEVIRNGTKYGTDISKEARVSVEWLYPILARLEKQEVIESAWGWDDDMIRRRIYYIKE